MALLLDRQYPAIVAQGVDDHRGVLARLDQLVEIADGAVLHGQCERPIDPAGLVVHEQVATHEVAGCQILMARHGDQREAQSVGHMLQKARLSASGRTLEHDRHLETMRLLEQFDLVASSAIVRLVEYAVVLDGQLLASMCVGVLVRVRWVHGRGGVSSRSHVPDLLALRVK